MSSSIWEKKLRSSSIWIKIEVVLRLHKNVRSSSILSWIWRLGLAELGNYKSDIKLLQVSLPIWAAYLDKARWTWLNLWHWTRFNLRDWTKHIETGPISDIEPGSNKVWSSISNQVQCDSLNQVQSANWPILDKSAIGQAKLSLSLAQLSPSCLSISESFTLTFLLQGCGWNMDEMDDMHMT